jgi:N utilization substance protein A
MSSIVLEALEALERSKRIDKKVLLEALEAAMASAGRKAYGANLNIAVEFNETNGEFKAYSIKKIVESVADADLEISLADARKKDPECQVDQEIRLLLPKVDFGRIAAQTAKQVVLQRVREAEREKVFEDFKNRLNDVLTAEVLRMDGRSVILDIGGGTEAVLPPKEQMFKEEVMPGDRLKVFVVDVRRTARGPQVVVSRTHPMLVKKLFEAEVPEIQEGIVEIKAVAREAGVRTKMAVQSYDEKVDPVGACVGMKGIRVQAVVTEILGEKIDIIPWSDEPAKLISAALSPARVSRVLIEEAAKKSTVVVAEDQLSLAIGKKGQNVRLAAKLTGWKVDVKSEVQMAEEQLREASQELAAQEAAQAASGEEEVFELPGIGAKLTARLIESGYDDLEKMAAASVEDLLKIEGIGEKTAEKIRDVAARLMRGEEIEEGETQGE